MSRALNQSGAAEIADHRPDGEDELCAGTAIEQPMETGETCLTLGQTADMVSIRKIESPQFYQPLRDPIARDGEPEQRDRDEVLPASVALVPLVAGQGRDPDDIEAPPSSGPRTNAAFLAQLIATHQGVQQTRMRGRVEADAGADAYEEQPSPAAGRFETYI